MKKICIFQTGEPLHIDQTISRPMRAINLSNFLLDMGYEVNLISSQFYHQKKCHRNLMNQTKYIHPKLKTSLIKSPGYVKNIGISRILDHINLARNLKKHLLINKNYLQTVDAIIAGFPPIETTYQLSLFCKKFKIPFVVDYKDQWPDIFSEGLPNRIKRLTPIIFYWWFLMTRRSLNEASLITVPTVGYQRFINERYTIENNKSMVFPLLEYNNGEKLVNSEIKNENITLFEKTEYFHFLGSFMSVFNFEPLIETAKMLLVEYPKVKILMCGSGGEYEKTRKKFANMSNVLFTGWLNEHEMSVLYQNSLGSIIPYKNIDNYTYHIPNKVIDSIKFGVPIISPLSGEVEHLIKDQNIGIFVNETNAVCYFKAFKTLLQDKKLRCSIRINCKNYFSKQLNPEIFYKEFLNKLKQLKA